MAANLCVESHPRDLLEQGFGVGVVRHAVAGPKLSEGDGYHAALVNFRYLANALWTTEDAVTRLFDNSRPHTPVRLWLMMVNLPDPCH